MEIQAADALSFLKRSAPSSRAGSPRSGSPRRCSATCGCRARRLGDYARHYVQTIHSSIILYNGIGLPRGKGRIRPIMASRVRLQHIVPTLVTDPLACTVRLNWLCAKLGAA